MMKSEHKYWKVECTRHLETIFETQINVKHISEKKLEAFIQALMFKYALSDNEILEQHLRIPFKKTKKYVQILRTNKFINGQLHINLIAQIADVSIVAYLTTVKILYK